MGFHRGRQPILVTVAHLPGPKLQRTGAHISHPGPGSSLLCNFGHDHPTSHGAREDRQESKDREEGRVAMSDGFSKAERDSLRDRYAADLERIEREFPGEIMRFPG